MFHAGEYCFRVNAATSIRGCKPGALVAHICVIDQARGQDDWTLAKFTFCVFSIKNAKRERGQYPAILTQLAWKSQKIFTATENILQKKTFVHPVGLRRNFIAGTKRAIPSGQYQPILPARVDNQNTEFASSCPLAELAI